MGEPVTHARALQKLGHEIAEELDSMRDETVLVEVRERLFLERSAPARLARRRKVFALGVPLAAAAGVAWFVGVRGSGAPALSFEVGDSASPGAQGAWVAASSAPVPLRFDDGSRFEIDVSGRARVASTHARAPELLLESGTLRGDVWTGRPDGTTWRVTAGPFEVEIDGGRFVMTWDPTLEELEVRDVSGRVVVRGPYAAEGVAVKRGEKLRVSLEQARLEVSASASAPPPPPAPHAAGEEP